jgi:molybdopterin-guanine dinucleotide biosynthesis protein A
VGAIIAGGKSRRFDGDKALAVLNGKALLDHVVDGISPSSDALVVCGRNWRDLTMLADRPSSGVGPLAGLSAALYYAFMKEYDFVLSATCDVLPVVGTEVFH